MPTDRSLAVGTGLQTYTKHRLSSDVHQQDVAPPKPALLSAISTPNPVQPTPSLRINPQPYPHPIPPIPYPFPRAPATNENMLETGAYG